MSAKRRTKHEGLHLPKITGSKKSKKEYNRVYWLKVASKQRRKK